MSPATPNTRELAARESNGIYVLLLWHPREDATHGLRRGRPPRRPLPTRGCCRPRPRCLLPPLRVRRLAAERRIVMSRNKHQNRNVAARMGRWSAAHWKTATFGWLALVVVAFAHRRPDRDEADRSERQGAGRVGPDGQDSRRRLQAARRRKRSDPEPLAAGGHARFRSRGRRRRRTPVEGGSRSERTGAQDRRRPPRSADRFRHQRRQGHRSRQARSGAHERRRCGEGPSLVLRRRVRRRERCEGRRHARSPTT